MSSGEFAPVLLNPNEFLKPLGFLPFPNILHPYIAALVLEIFLYGIYSVLFSMCIYVLIRRRDSVHWILPVLTIVMFSIATADICYTIFLHFRRALKATLTFHDMKPKYWLFVTNNILADCTFLYRCYVVWGGDLRIMVVPGILFIISVVFGYVFEVSSSIAIVYGQGWKYITVTFILNVILTGLTAGRIWWFSWKRRDVLDNKSRRRYQAALASVIESGVLVALYMIPEFIITSIILDNTFVQVVGIVPTLIVVQVGLGRAVKPDEEVLSTLEPMQAAGPATAKSHVISFFSSMMQTGRVQSKGGGSISSDSILVCPDQLRSGEHKISIDVVGEKEEESKGGKGPEIV